MKETKKDVFFNVHLLSMLVCPLTKGSLRYDATTHELLSKQANLAYPIREGVPIMLVEEARPLQEGESE